MSGEAFRAQSVAQATRWQRERVTTLVAKHERNGISIAAMARALAWPADSVAHWVADLLDRGELVIRPGEEAVAYPRFVTTAFADALSQADGGA